jgi:heme exporter protein B
MDGARPSSAPLASRANAGPLAAGSALGARRGPGMRAAVGALLHKELLVELRTLESVPGMSLFAVSTFVVFHFALNRGSVEGDLAAGILFVTLLLASLLGINRLFVADAEQGGFDGFLLAPVDASAMFIAKALALFAYLVALEVVAVAAFALLLLGPSIGHSLPGVLLVLVLADVGVALVGTLVAALVVRSRARDMLGPLIVLPLLIPIVIGGASALAPLLAAHPPSLASWISGSAARWLATLALYDLLFGLLAYAVFDFLLED